MNYFEPFQKDSDQHEDHLTRAFLVLLRFSPVALLAFYDTVYEVTIGQAKKLNKKLELPAPFSLPISEVDLQTQTRTISREPIGVVISVLLTDSPIEVESLIEPSKRGAVYDGVVRFGEVLALVIENKPRHGNVWREQLNPSKASLENTETLVKVPAIVEWKSILRTLNEIRRMESLSGTERMMINDFRQFVTSKFSYLNPYDRLSLCGTDEQLIQNRIEELLREIAVNPESIIFGKRWNTWCLDTGINEMRLIGFTINHIMKDDGNITIGMYFGDIVNQARSFFKRNIDFEEIERYQDLGWEILPSIHIWFANIHMFILECSKKHTKDFYQYWRNSQDEIRQYESNELLQLIGDLEEKGWIIISDERRDDIIDKVENSKRKKYNVAPRIGIVYSIPIKQARDLDDKGKLAQEFYRLVTEGTTLVEKDTSQLLKDPNANRSI